MCYCLRYGFGADCVVFAFVCWPAKVMMGVLYYRDYIASIRIFVNTQTLMNLCALMPVGHICHSACCCCCRQRRRRRCMSAYIMRSFYLHVNLINRSINYMTYLNSVCSDKLESMNRINLLQFERMKWEHFLSSMWMKKIHKYFQLIYQSSIDGARWNTTKGTARLHNPSARELRKPKIKNDGKTLNFTIVCNRIIQ